LNCKQQFHLHAITACILPITAILGVSTNYAEVVGRLGDCFHLKLD